MLEANFVIVLCASFGLLALVLLMLSPLHRHLIFAHQRAYHRRRLAHLGNLRLRLHQAKMNLIEHKKKILG